MMKILILIMLTIFTGCASSSLRLPDPVRVTAESSGHVKVGSRTYNVKEFKILTRQWYEQDHNAGVIIDAPEEMVFPAVGRLFDAVIAAGIHRVSFAATRDGKAYLLGLVMPCPCPPPPRIVWVKIQPDGRLNYEVTAQKPGVNGRVTESKKDMASVEQFRQTLADTAKSDPQLQVWMDMMNAGLHKHFIDTLYTCHVTGVKDVVFIVKESENPNKASEPSVAPAPQVQR